MNYFKKFKNIVIYVFVWKSQHMNIKTSFFLTYEFVKIRIGYETKNFASKYGVENENMLMCVRERETRRYWERERINCCVKSIKIRRFKTRLFVWIYVRISDYFYFRYVWNIFWYLLARSYSFQLIYGFFSFVWVLSVAAHSIFYWTNPVNFVRHVIVL